jgi:phenylpyruvate tautomerase PptA (4-oxalocrotonate tautomerase family)
MEQSRHPMPSITIDVCREYGAQEGRALLDAVHQALIDAFRIDPANRNMLLVVHPAERLVGKPGVEPADRITRVTIHCAPGRSTDAKRRLYADLARRLEALGIPPPCLLVRVIEMPEENFGVRGGQALCDVDLGYPLEV